MTTPEVASVAPCPTPGHALLELCPDAALVHERGVVILANSAAARLLGAPVPEALVGRDLASYVDPSCTGPGETLGEMRTSDGRRFPAWLQELRLCHGGRLRRTLVARSIHPPLPDAPMSACHPIQRALAALEPLVLQVARPTIALDARAQLHGDEVLVERLARTMILDALAALDAGTVAENRLAVFLVGERSGVKLEVVADGVAGGQVMEGDSFGVDLARRTALPLDAELRVDAPGPGQRRLVARWRRAAAP